MGFMDSLKSFQDKMNEQKAKQDAAAKAGTLRPAGAPPVKHNAPAPSAAPKAAPASSNTTIKNGETREVKFGTQNPIPYHDPQYNIGVYIKTNGIAYVTVVGVPEISEMMIKSMIIDELQGQFMKLSGNVPVDQLPIHVHELSTAVSMRLKEKGVDSRVQIMSICPDEKSREKLKSMEQQKLASDPNAMAEALVKSQEQAMAHARAMAAAAAAPADMICPTCGGAAGNGKFCCNCGAPLR